MGTNSKSIIRTSIYPFKIDEYIFQKKQVFLNKVSVQNVPELSLCHVLETYVFPQNRTQRIHKNL